MPFLSREERGRVYEKVLATIDTKLMAQDTPPDIKALREEFAAGVLEADSPESFEDAMNTMLRRLGVSHAGFFHEAAPRAAGRVAIAATFMKADTRDGSRWVFQDVHPGGAAEIGGVRPGDTLLSIGGKEFTPPQAMPFVLGEQYRMTVRRPDGSTAEVTLAVPSPKNKKQPVVIPEQVVSARKLSPDAGLMRVSMFPGVLGMDVARNMSRAVADLDCPKLIVDLRGNTGGGIGCLRLMSLMCPDRRGVGYSIGKKQAQAGYTKERLPTFDRIPTSKMGVIPLIFKFALRGRSVAVYSEGLGDRLHHGRIALLINEHSASAAEMVAAFASEYKLATLIGTKTAGRLVAATAFKVGHGYRMAVPVAAYFTWKGTDIEGVGVAPDVPMPMNVEALWSGRDSQLEKALATLAG